MPHSSRCPLSLGRPRAPCLLHAPGSHPIGAWHLARGRSATDLERKCYMQSALSATRQSAWGVFHFRGRGCLRVNIRRPSRYTSWFHHSALEMRLPTIGRREAGRISSSGERSEVCIERCGRHESAVSDRPPGWNAPKRMLAWINARRLGRRGRPPGSMRIPIPAPAGGGEGCLSSWRLPLPRSPRNRGVPSHRL
jgi:hypothetical protein